MNGSREKRRPRAGSSRPFAAAVGVACAVAIAAGVVYVAARRGSPAPPGPLPEKAGAARALRAEAGSAPPSAAKSPSPAEVSQGGPRGPGKGAPPAPVWTPDDFVAVSGASSPRVAYALKVSDGRLLVAIEAEAFEPDGSGVSVRLGLAAARKLLLDGSKAAVERSSSAARFVFTAAAEELVAAEEDWKKLRMALDVQWAGGPYGKPRLHERFLHADRRAAHAGLSERPEDWSAIDPQEHARLVADRKTRIVIPISQPMDGKVTVVIEDTEGRRVRNLIAGRPTSAGRHEIEWDGLDEEERLVGPGKYRWKSIHHPGIRPEYLMSFCNGGERFLEPFGSNHQHFVAACANERYVFLAAPMTEGGYAMIACDPAGAWRHGYNPILGSGMDAVAVAADDRYLYAAHDGQAWGQAVDRGKPDWKLVVKTTLTRFEIDSGRTVDYPGGRFAVLEEHEFGPGAANPALRGSMSLGGMALVGDRLYISSRAAGAVLVVEKDSARKVDEFGLESPGALAAAGPKLLAVSGRSIVEIDPASKARRTILPPGELEPRALAADGKGAIYVADARSHTVKVFSQGRLVRTIGRPGGPYKGRYDPERMVNPSGLALVGGRLWVAEDRDNPKRAHAWDLARGTVEVEKFGNPPYGGSGAGFDPADPSRWIGHGALWRLDFAAKSAECLSILGSAHGQMHYRIVRKDGRTFAIGLGGITTIDELAGDGTLRHLAFLSSTHRYCFALDWNPPQAFVEAFERAYPTRKGKHAEKGPGVLWVDLDGDGRPSASEFDFSTAADDFAGAYWGHDFYDLTMKVPATVKGRRVLVTLEPKGYHASGAPRYPRLNDACAAGVPVALEHNQVETAVDRFGDMICNSDPAMKCFAPDGRLLWTYPNRWTNVHGSHAAPLPETGVMQGALFFLGMARLDDSSDCFVVNGNHGRFFVLTSDGLYLDEMFKDVRLGGSRDEFWIGGECFGGVFGRSEDGAYYLQTGGDGYRVFRLHGLAEAVRARGEVVVTPEQLMAAERKLARSRAPVRTAKEAVVRRLAKSPEIDGRDGDWGGEFSLAWDKGGRFPVRVRAGYDDAQLYLFYDVWDDSPWVNGGKDWTTLFKTGDSVDLQLGTDPSAPGDRKGPAKGDLRLLVAPLEGRPVAVLYRHRVSGAKNPVVFTSPWRSETVDVVRRLDSARIAVERGGDYYRVEVAVPLAELGLEAPAGRSFRGDFGVIYGDPGGTVNVLRSYWSNQATMLVNDVPGEIMLHPEMWGSVTFAEGGAR